MITFKQFLNESKSAPLYHATRISRINQLLDSDTLLPFRGAPGEEPAVSFTRSLDTAFHHGQVMHGSRNEVVVLELDQQKLTQNYKVRPYQFWSQPTRTWTRVDKARLMPIDIETDEMYNEFEERVVNKPIKNLSKYIKKIIFFTAGAPKNLQPHNLDKYKSILWNYTTKKWIFK